MPGAEAARLLRSVKAQRRSLEAAWAPVLRVEAEFERLKDYGAPRAYALLVRWVRAQVRRIGAPGCVVGVSGGVDSTLAALVLRDAAPRGSLALILPHAGSKADERDALALVRLLGLRHRVFPIGPWVDTLTRSYLGGPGSTQLAGNLASRLRNTILYLEANASGRLVLGTSNLDEGLIGYGCKGGAVDLGPLAGLHKEEVRLHVKRRLSPLDARLAKRLSERPATPGYFPGQQAERELGLPYAIIGRGLDVLTGFTRLGPAGFLIDDPPAFEHALREKGLSSPQVGKVMAMVLRNGHKVFGSSALRRGKG